MSCYEELHAISRQGYSAEQLESLIERYGSEVYISAATITTLRTSRFEITNQLVDHAAELIDWSDPPAPIHDLLECIDHDDILKSGDPIACKELCRQAASRVNNIAYRVTLLSVLGYYLLQAENNQLAE